VADSGGKEIRPHGKKHGEVFRAQACQQETDILPYQIFIRIQGKEFLKLIYLSAGDAGFRTVP
jgi:hypothetical protein